MTLTVPERRRSQRVTLGEPYWLTVPSTWAVQLVDVSVGGIAFASPYGLEVGRSDAGARDTRARRIQRADRDLVGAVLGETRRAPCARSLKSARCFSVPLDESSQRALESFLKLSSPERA